MVSAGALVSVIMPVFNGEMFVASAIHSIQGQKFNDWELVIVDDCSTDRSFDICSSFSTNDSRIRLFRNSENKGLAKTMNTLISLSRGKYIAVQEQDDISVEDRLILETEILQSQPAVGCVSGVAAWLDDHSKVFSYFSEFLNNGNQYPQNQKEMVRYLYAEQCKVVNAACMYRRAAIRDMHGPYDADAKMSIDWQFFIHIAHKYLFFGIPKTLVKMHRGNSHQSLTKMKALQFEEANRCIDLIYNTYKNDNDSPINYWLYRKAMSTELVLEGRYYSRILGLSRLFLAILFYPVNKRAYRSIAELFLRGIRKLHI